MAYWFGFAAVAGAFGGLIAFGVQHIESSVEKWRLLFIIEASTSSLPFRSVNHLSWPHREFLPSCWGSWHCSCFRIARNQPPSSTNVNVKLLWRGWTDQPAAIPVQLWTRVIYITLPSIVLCADPLFSTHIFGFPWLEGEYWRFPVIYLGSLAIVDIHSRRYLFRSKLCFSINIRIFAHHHPDIRI